MVLHQGSLTSLKTRLTRIPKPIDVFLKTACNSITLSFNLLFISSVSIYSLRLTINTRLKTKNAIAPTSSITINASNRSDCKNWLLICGIIVNPRILATQIAAITAKAAPVPLVKRRISGCTPLNINQAVTQCRHYNYEISDHYEYKYSNYGQQQILQK